MRPFINSSKDVDFSGVGSGALSGFLFSINLFGFVVVMFCVLDVLFRSDCK